MVVAIDGPGGVGKSTVSRRVAAARDLDYLDTGATYRAAALACLEAGTDLADEEAARTAVEAAEIAYADGAIFLNGRDVSAAIRTPEITAASSAVAALPAVRRLVVAMQRAWAASRDGEAVVEGRDIGTVVFPDAEVKIFLTARPEVRAARRAGDPEAQGAGVSEVRQALDARDRADSTREASPLRPAADAVVIDTSDMTLNEVIAAVLLEVDKDQLRPELPPSAEAATPDS